MPSAGREVRSRSPLRGSWIAAALLVAGSGAGAAGASDGGAGANDLHLSGFGTVGLVHVNARSGVGFTRDETERANAGGTRADIDTRLGVQLNYRASSQFELVGQLVGANRVPASPASDIATLAFAAWRPNDEITLRAGRMSTDYYLLADYRHVGFAYPFVRPPVEQYDPVPYDVDGIDLTKAWHFDESVWKLRGVVGRSQLENHQSTSGLRMRPFYSLVLSGDDGNGLSLKASVSRVWLHGDLSALRPLLGALDRVAALPDATVAAEARALAAALDFGDQAVTYSALGVAYDRGAWLASVEIARNEPQKTNPYTSAWALAGRRWGPVTVYGVVSAIHTEQTRSPPQWAAALTPIVGAGGAAQAQMIGDIAIREAASTNANQRTLTLGVRWDLSDRIALKLQWDHVRVDAYATRFWSTVNPVEPIHANVGSATIDFVF